MQPEQPRTLPPDSASQPPRKKSKIIIPIILMTWPVAGVILAIILYAITNFVTGTVAPSSEDDLFATNPLQTIINIALFFVGGASIALGPISFIVGLVLLIVNLNQKK